MCCPKSSLSPLHSSQYSGNICDISYMIINLIIWQYHICYKLDGMVFIMRAKWISCCKMNHKSLLDPSNYLSCFLDFVKRSLMLIDRQELTAVGGGNNKTGKKYLFRLWTHKRQHMPCRCSLGKRCGELSRMSCVRKTRGVNIAIIINPHTDYYGWYRIHVPCQHSRCVQCLRNYIGTSAFADFSYLMADVEAKFYV